MKVNKLIWLALSAVLLEGAFTACSLQSVKKESEGDKALFAADNKALIAQMLGNQKKVVHGMVLQEDKPGWE